MRSYIFFTYYHENLYGVSMPYPNLNLPEPHVPTYRTHWTAADLDALRHVGDPIADPIAQSLIENGQVQAVNQALAWLEDNSGPIPPELPENLSLFLEMGALPHWADLDRIERAQKMFTSKGTAFGIALLFRSLPVLYCGNTGGAQTLAITGQLPKRFRRRAAETLRFILDVMEPGGLSPQGKGLRSIQKVRHMHASIRWLATHAGAKPGSPAPSGPVIVDDSGVPSSWDTKAWALPINQEEKLGTMLAFSTQAIFALRRLGVDVSTQEAEDLLYTWRIVGHLLGIESNQMPYNTLAADNLWALIRQRNFGPSTSGTALMKAHMQFLEDYLVPGTLLDPLVPAMLRFLMGKQMAVEYLGVPKAGLWTLIVLFLRQFLGLGIRLHESTHSNAELVAEGQAIMEALQHYWQGPDLAPPFRIPEQLGVMSPPKAPSN